MRKIIQENKNDGFINLYEEGIFVKSYEYSAVRISEITGYRLIADINKKSGMIYLVCSFPKDRKEKILGMLEKDNVRIKDSKGDIEEKYAGKGLEKNMEKLVSTKKSLVIFD